MTGIEQKLDYVNEQTKFLAKKIKELQSVITGLSNKSISKIDSMRNKTEYLSVQFREFASEINTSRNAKGPNIDFIKQDLNTINDDIIKLQNLLDDMSKENGVKFDDLQKSVAVQIESLNTKFNELKSVLDAVSKDTANKIDSVKTDILNKNQSLDNKISELQNTINTNHQNTKSGIDDLGQRVDNVSSKIESDLEKLDVLINQNNMLQNKITENNNEIYGLHAIMDVYFQVLKHKNKQYTNVLSFLLVVILLGVIALVYLVLFDFGII